MITSSTSAGSSFARSSAAFTTCPPMVAPWVMLSAPFQLLHSGVRAVETITASVISYLQIQAPTAEDAEGAEEKLNDELQIPADRSGIEAFGTCTTRAMAILMPLLCVL